MTTAEYHILKLLRDGSYIKMFYQVPALAKRAILIPNEREMKVDTAMSLAKQEFIYFSESRTVERGTSCYVISDYGRKALEAEEVKHASTASTVQ